MAVNSSADLPVAFSGESWWIRDMTWFSSHRDSETENGNAPTSLELERGSRNSIFRAKPERKPASALWQRTCAIQGDRLRVHEFSWIIIISCLFHEISLPGRPLDAPAETRNLR